MVIITYINNGNDNTVTMKNMHGNNVVWLYTKYAVEPNLFRLESSIITRAKRATNRNNAVPTTTSSPWKLPCVFFIQISKIVQFLMLQTCLRCRISLNTWKSFRKRKIVWFYSVTQQNINFEKNVWSYISPETSVFQKLVNVV